MPANVIVLGAACQRGALPLSLDALRQAFTLNGVAVETNLAAFAWGRAAVAARRDRARRSWSARPRRWRSARAARALVDAAAPEPGELRRLRRDPRRRSSGLGGTKAARRYARDVAAVRELEARRSAGTTAVVPRPTPTGLHKLMAYKDEYEVARLHLDGLRDQPKGTKVTLLLHPPLLRAMGMDRKVGLGRWFVPFLRVLRAGRRLRGTPLDVFGHTKVRRVERALPAQYTELVSQALQAATPETAATVCRIAALPDVVRGYEELKLAGVERFHADAQMLLGELDA